MTDLQATDAEASRADPLAPAIHLMDAFARRTGLTSSSSPRRYLWTDAFAVCNFLSLARATGDRRHADLALALVGQVHDVLGQHREDDPRTGWLSGLPPDQAAQHPTAGGLRIGKPLRERTPEEEVDERLEWERDGQYFHYLTRWMHALHQVARYTGEGRFHLWARELAEVAYAAFFVRPTQPGAPRVSAWKMSIDLSRPLVLARGQRDAIDGLITVLELRAGPGGATEPDLRGPALGLADLLDLDAIEPSADPLDLGSLLVHVWRLWSLTQKGQGRPTLLEALLEAALRGLRSRPLQAVLRGPASQRVAFRELGLVLGLQAMERLLEETTDSSQTTLNGESLDALRYHVPMGRSVLDFWRQQKSNAASPWQDIDDVMLATCLVPEGYLEPSLSCAD